MVITELCRDSDNRNNETGISQWPLLLTWIYSMDTLFHPSMET